MVAGDGTDRAARPDRTGSAAPLTIGVLGSVRVLVGDVTVPIPNRKGQALLAYLALHRDRRETRERLAGLLWSSVDKDKRQTSLRQELSELKRAFRRVGYADFDFGRLTISLPPTGVAVDLWDVVASAEAHAPHQLLLDTPRLTETLLADLVDVDPDFRDWLMPTRAALHGRILRHLEEGLRDPATPTDQHRRIAEAIHAQDPTHEEACRALMRARAMGGDAAGAVRDYESLRALLAEEYDSLPEAETEALYVAIKNAELEARGHEGLAPGSRLDPMVHRGVTQLLIGVDRQAPSPDAGSRPTRITLVLEPFRQTGVEPDRFHLVEGFRHHLMASLVRFREWAVVDAAAQPAPEPPAGEGASYAVAATAYQAGEQISVQLTLRDRTSGTVVWSNPFELTLETWFAARQRVMRGIAMSLNVQMSVERLMRLDGRPDTTLEVYDRWLRGQALMRPFRRDNWNRAALIFSEAIRDAPSFSLAYSSLAQMNTTRHIVHPGVLRDRAKAETTVELARKAVALDPLDSRAHLALGWALAFLDRHSQAAVAIEKACETNPYDAWTLVSAGLFHAYDGNPNEAQALAEQSLNMTVSPSLVQRGYVGTIQYLLGDYAAAIASTERSQDVIHTLPAWRAAAHFRLGDHEAAAASLRQFLDVMRAQWCGPEPATEASIGYWLLHQYPMSKAHVWERLRDGLVGAGLRAAPIEFGAWWNAVAEA